MWIQIRWLRQKPADLDLQCVFLKKRINQGSTGKGLKIVLNQDISFSENSVDQDRQFSILPLTIYGLRIKGEVGAINLQ